MPETKFLKQYASLPILNPLTSAKVKVSLDDLRILPPIPEHNRKSNIETSALL
jgi:hypothetical protein